MRLSFAFLILVSGLAAQKPAATKQTAFDKATLERYVRHLYVWNPEVKVEIENPKPSAQLPGFMEVAVHAAMGPQRQDEVFLVSRDGRRILRGLVYDVAQNPFKPQLDKLKTAFQPSMGEPGAPVVIVLFTDFQCPYCKQAAKTLHDKLLTTFPKQVRLYFKDYPLEALHPWAKPAAIAGRCVFRQNPLAFWEYHDWIYEHQQDITTENFPQKAMEFAKSKEKEIDATQLAQCIENRATEADIDKSIAEGRALQVFSTPTLFVNGRQVVGVDWEKLRLIIQYEIEYQKTAKNAGEDCGCSIQLSSPVTN